MDEAPVAVVVVKMDVGDAKSDEKEEDDSEVKSSVQQSHQDR